MKLGTIERARKDSLGFDIWDAVHVQAERSTLGSFRTGAIVFNTKTLEMIGKGCSHHSVSSVLSTVHAEEHALKDCWGIRNNLPLGYSIALMTIGKAGNPTYSSRPCAHCALRLENSGIEFVYYPERINSGDWVINCDTPSSLAMRIEDSNIRMEYAKDMRIK